ncbi:hypothetical protein HOP50_05g36790 [Chloropicon primus]|uniref:COMM domain-containing protein n=1 Tax=Chloropicon primus TaxID=1764295 RepID=A0A5B8MLG6_9CHLO|nr:hypothetical protein A3770_05p36690 [Chloropicon primus]UPR00365.1 hypothetical protein HOP50_05g36790 [Chloropicon primus]|mmetsp:Transcript_13467/g.37821  ORF Transcript_13467/g.37821 Transcript_13467/m.37821 type:complete len:181 (-) Transcript_13467:1730-2272(-)|eukprot:QDZ21151.1 hypothetical protein A3770_05p36690 [Chloropicon primus]
MESLMETVEGLVGREGARGAEERIKTSLDLVETTSTTETMEDLAPVEALGLGGASSREALKVMRGLKRAAVYSLEELDGMLSEVNAKAASLKVMRAVLVDNSERWREGDVQTMVSLPKLKDVSWQVVDQATVEPKIDFDLKVAGEGGDEQIRFKAGRGMLTVLTDSLKRVKNELQSVSGA